MEAPFAGFATEIRRYGKQNGSKDTVIFPNCHVASIPAEYDDEKSKGVGDPACHFQYGPIRLQI
jgi:hypothetical protein